MLFLLVSSSQVSPRRNPQEPSRRLLSSSSTFVHCFCCLRNKNMKIAIVAAYWTTVMALRTLARPMLARHPLPGRAQGLLGTPQDDPVLPQRDEIAGCAEGTACRGLVSTPQPSEMQVPVLLALAQLLPVRAHVLSCDRPNSDNTHPCPDKSQETLYFRIRHCLLSGLVQRYWPTLFSWGNPSTNFEGKGSILIPISALAPSSDSERLFQAGLLHLKTALSQLSGHAAFLTDTHCHQQPFPGQ